MPENLSIPGPFDPPEPIPPLVQYCVLDWIDPDGNTFCVAMPFGPMKMSTAFRLMELYRKSREKYGAKIRYFGMRDKLDGNEQVLADA